MVVFISGLLTHTTVDNKSRATNVGFPYKYNDMLVCRQSLIYGYRYDEAGIMYGSVLWMNLFAVGWAYLARCQRIKYAFLVFVIYFKHPINTSSTYQYVYDAIHSFLSFLINYSFLLSS